MEDIGALAGAGADVNATGELGNTPLHEVVYQNHVEVVEFLLKHGASRAIKNDMAETPMDVAKSQGKDAIVKILLA
jgi:ankyrin repeat protein